MEFRNSYRLTERKIIVYDISFYTVAKICSINMVLDPHTSVSLIEKGAFLSHDL